MTNKELISLLSGFSMKSEVEVTHQGQTLQVDKAVRVYIPESKDEQGRKIAARNIVQIILKSK